MDESQEPRTGGVAVWRVRYENMAHQVITEFVADRDASREEGDDPGTWFPLAEAGARDRELAEAREETRGRRDPSGADLVMPHRPTTDQRSST